MDHACLFLNFSRPVSAKRPIVRPRKGALLVRHLRTALNELTSFALTGFTVENLAVGLSQLKNVELFVLTNTELSDDEFLLVSKALPNATLNDGTMHGGKIGGATSWRGGKPLNRTTAFVVP